MQRIGLCIIIFAKAILRMRWRMRQDHAERFMKQLGLNIAYHRKLKGLTQEQLAELAGISRTHLSNIEAPNMPTSMSIDTFFDIAKLLGVEPAKLLELR